MAETSAIEWTDATWNVVTGCTRVSPGCAHCYIENTPPFRIAGRKFERVGNEETTGLVFHPERLELPLRWRRPRRVFVNSLSDLFHEGIPDEFVEQVLDVMMRADRHTFQVLTKRPERARDFLLRYYNLDDERYADLRCEPLPNVWVGVSIENARYTWRADVLREIPAAVRFLSCEPLLGSLYPDDLRHELPFDPARPEHRALLNLRDIDWVIAGGESGGRHARPMHPDWAREIRDHCLAEDYIGPGEVGRSGPAFFFKQWGSHDEHGVYKGASPKSGGRLLDGKTWDETP